MTKKRPETVQFHTASGLENTGFVKLTSKPLTGHSSSVVPNLFLMVNHVKYGILIFHNYLKCLVFLVLFEEIVSF